MNVNHHGSSSHHPILCHVGGQRLWLGPSPEDATAHDLTPGLRIPGFRVVAPGFGSWITQAHMDGAWIWILDPAFPGSWVATRVGGTWSLLLKNIIKGIRGMNNINNGITITCHPTLLILVSQLYTTNNIFAFLCRMYCGKVCQLMELW